MKKSGEEKALDFEGVPTHELIKEVVRRGGTDKSDTFSEIHAEAMGVINHVLMMGKASDMPEVMNIPIIDVEAVDGSQMQMVLNVRTVPETFLSYE